MQHTQEKQHVCSTCSDSDNARVAVQHIVSLQEMVRARANVMVYRTGSDKGNTADGYDDDRETGMGSCILRSAVRRHQKRGGCAHKGWGFIYGHNQIFF